MLTERPPPPTKQDRSTARVIHHLPLVDAECRVDQNGWMVLLVVDLLYIFLISLIKPDKSRSRSKWVVESQGSNYNQVFWFLRPRPAIKLHKIVETR